MSPESVTSAGDVNRGLDAIPGTYDFNRFLHVYAAFALAFPAHLYGRLQQQKVFLTSLEPISVAIFIALWSVLIPAIILFVIAGIRSLSSRFNEPIVACFVGGCSSLIFLELFSRRSFDEGFGLVTIAFGVLCGIVSGRGYCRWRWIRSTLEVAAFGSLILPTSLIWAFVQATALPRIEQKLTAGNPVPIVMVVFDCLCGVNLMNDKRQIDADRYPRLAELARTSNWYRNCTSVHPRTIRAIPALLTGRLPLEPRDADANQYPQNLFTLLNATRSYELTSFEPFTKMCPRDRLRDRARPNLRTQWVLLTYTTWVVFLNDLLPPDLGMWGPWIPRVWFGLSHDMQVDRDQRRGLIRYEWDLDREKQIQHFLNCIDNSDKPNVWFGHFALPHYPWCYLPSGHLYDRDYGLGTLWGAEGTLNEDWADDELATRHAFQQHLLQLGYADQVLGRLIDRLRQVNLFDRCLLVVVADHGMSFRNGLSGRIPTESNLADIMSVPLFIKYPNQKSADIIDLNVETIDVLPTIMDVVGLSVPDSMDGHSLIADNFVERPKKVFLNEDDRVEIDADFAAKYESLRRQLELFGIGADPLRIFKIGPHSELIGRSVGELAGGGKSPLTIRPLNFLPSVEYQPPRLVPVHLKARIESAVEVNLPAKFAISVNDTIWGTTQTYRLKYLDRFWTVMLPESAFQPGMNQIRVFQIMESAEGLNLEECSIGARDEQQPQIPSR